MSREIALIAKEGERERSDIDRFLAREQAERDREIALAAKTRELEIAETKRLASTAEREKAEHTVESVRVVADAERSRQVEVIEAGKSRGCPPHRRGEQGAGHAHAHDHPIRGAQAAADLEAEATLIRARATTEAQKIGAEGIEREAGARGRAEMEVEQLRIANSQRHARSRGDRAGGQGRSAQEVQRGRDLPRARAVADRGRTRRSYRSGQGDGHARCPAPKSACMAAATAPWTRSAGCSRKVSASARCSKVWRNRFPRGSASGLSANGIQGLLGRPYNGSSLKQTYEHLNALVQEHLRTKKAREVPFPEALTQLGEHAGRERRPASGGQGCCPSSTRKARSMTFHSNSVWTMINAVAKSAG